MTKGSKFIMNTRVFIDGYESIVELTRFVLIVYVNSIRALSEHGHIVVDVEYFNRHKAVASSLGHAMVLGVEHYIHGVGSVLGHLIVERLQVGDDARALPLHLIVLELETERVLRRTIADLGRKQRYFPVVTSLVIVLSYYFYLKKSVLIGLVIILAVVFLVFVGHELWRVHVDFYNEECHCHCALKNDYIFVCEDFIFSSWMHFKVILKFKLRIFLPEQPEPAGHEWPPPDELPSSLSKTVNVSDLSKLIREPCSFSFTTPSEVTSIVFKTVLSSL